MSQNTESFGYHLFVNNDKHQKVNASIVKSY